MNSDKKRKKVSSIAMHHDFLGVNTSRYIFFGGAYDSGKNWSGGKRAKEGKKA